MIEFNMCLYIYSNRARLTQEWTQGKMWLASPILNCSKTLNMFDELKYIMRTYKSMLVGNASFESF